MSWNFANSLEVSTVSAATNGLLVTAVNNALAALDGAIVHNVSYLMYEGAAVYVAFICYTPV